MYYVENGGINPDALYVEMGVSSIEQRNRFHIELYISIVYKRFRYNDRSCSFTGQIRPI